MLHLQRGQFKMADRIGKPVSQNIFNGVRKLIVNYRLRQQEEEGFVRLLGRAKN